MHDNDHTDSEIARREHDLEMGGETADERRWGRWANQAAAKLIALGITTTRKGIDGNEYTGDGDADEGFSIDRAYDAFLAGWSTDTYVGYVVARREELGL